MGPEGTGPEPRLRLHDILLVTRKAQNDIAMPTPRSDRHENVRRYRARMRARGFRQIQLWVPDTRSAQFGEACRRQSLLIATDPAEQVIMDELEAL
jgi:hypothetical protein